jgi:hypothetical protein
MLVIPIIWYIFANGDKNALFITLGFFGIFSLVFFFAGIMYFILLRKGEL